MKYLAQLRTVTAISLLLLCSCDWSGNTTGPKGPTRHSTVANPVFASGHERMLYLLQQIKERVPKEHKYYGRGEPARLRQELELQAPDLNPVEKIAALYRTGYSEMMYETTPKLAIEHLTEAYELLSMQTDLDPQLSIPVKFYLGLSWLRHGETENCCVRHNAESCILPIRGNGLHTQPQGSRQAIKYFLEVLKDTQRDKDHVSWHDPARWLMNIAYMTLGEYPEHVPEKFRIPTSIFQSEVEFPKFENVLPRLHLDTFSHAGGVVVDDFDNDNYLDILTTSSAPTMQMRFFRNNRDGTFTDRTKEANLLGMYGGLNMVQADYNNDGNVDVFVLRGAWLGESGRHPNSLLRNNGKGQFTDVTFEAGLGEVHNPCKTAAWADYDNDGDLDLYIANEAGPERRLVQRGAFVRAPSQLFRNNNDGTFTDVAAGAGVDQEVFGMGTVWGDFDGDRFPDLFISSDPGHTLFHNNRDGTFTNVTKSKGITRPISAFPVWFWDFDNDGALDLYVSSSSGPVAVLGFDGKQDVPGESEGFIRRLGSAPDVPHGPWVEYEMPALYRGDGQGGFSDVAREQKLTYPALPMGANFGDLNGDGFLDFYLATGNVAYWELRPNVMFLNQGASGFADVTMSGGFGHLQKGHGVSFADIDNDGDQDVYVQMGGQLPGDKFDDALFENPGFGVKWITLRLVGNRSNKSAIGTSIHVTTIEEGKPRSIYRHVNSGGSFGCNPLRQNIGLGRADRIESIEIHWPTSDRRQVFRDVSMNECIQIVEDEDRYTKLPFKPIVLGGAQRR